MHVKVERHLINRPEIFGGKIIKFDLANWPGKASAARVMGVGQDAFVERRDKYAAPKPPEQVIAYVLFSDAVGSFKRPSQIREECGFSL